MTRAELVQIRDFGIVANIYAMRLQLTGHPLDKEGARVAYEVAREHLQLAHSLSVSPVRA